MKLTGVELRTIEMPLVSPFRTSFGTQTVREVLLLRAVTDDGEGWGECVAMADPRYSSEYARACADVLRTFLVPELARQVLERISIAEPLVEERSWIHRPDSPMPNSRWVRDTERVSSARVI